MATLTCLLKTKWTHYSHNHLSVENEGTRHGHTHLSVVNDGGASKRPAAQTEDEGEDGGDKGSPGVGRRAGLSLWLACSDLQRQNNNVPSGQRTGRLLACLLACLVAFSSLARIWGEGLAIHSPPALSFFFFFKWRLARRTPIPLFFLSFFFRPRSVHNGSAS